MKSCADRNLSQETRLKKRSASIEMVSKQTLQNSSNSTHRMRKNQYFAISTIYFDTFRFAILEKIECIQLLDDAFKIRETLKLKLLKKNQ